LPYSTDAHKGRAENFKLSDDETRQPPNIYFDRHH